jgi:hypothetical protein
MGHRHSPRALYGWWQVGGLEGGGSFRWRGLPPDEGVGCARSLGNLYGRRARELSHGTWRGTSVSSVWVATASCPSAAVGLERQQRECGSEHEAAASCSLRSRVGSDGATEVWAIGSIGGARGAKEGTVHDPSRGSLRLADPLITRSRKGGSPSQGKGAHPLKAGGSLLTLSRH